MLKTFRNMTTGIGAWILVGLFILAFAFVGVLAPNNYGRNATIQVGEAKFTIRDVEREFLKQINDRRRDTGEVLSRDEAIKRGLLDQTINTLSLRGLYEAEAQKLGITVSDKMMQDFLNAQENLQNPRTGKFDRSMLERLVQSMNVTLTQFKVLVREDLLRQQIDQAIAIATPAPKTMARYIALRQTEERVIRTAKLPLAEQVAPTDVDLQSFYAANADAYVTPELRDYNLVILDKDVLRSKITVDEAEVKRLFNARIGSLGTPEKRSFAQAVLRNQDVADQVLAAIGTGQSFADAVAAAGTNATSFTEQTRGAILDDKVAAAVFAAEGPTLIGPIDGDFGIILADLTAIIPAIEVDFDAVRADLEAELFDEEYRTQIDEIYNIIQEAGDGGIALLSAAEEADIPVRNIGPVDRNFLTPTGGMISDVAPAVHFSAFRLGQNASFEEVDLPGGQYAFVETTNITPATQRPYDAVADMVLVDFLADAKRTNSNNTSTQFEALITQGKSFEIAALEMGGEVISRTVLNGETIDDIPAIMVRDLFSAPIGELVSTPIDSGALLAQVDSVRFGPNAQIDGMVSVARQQLTETLSGEYFDAYIMAAQEEFPVQTKAEEIAKAFSISEQ